MQVPRRTPLSLSLGSLGVIPAMPHLALPALVCSALIYCLPCRAGELSALFDTLHPTDTPRELIEPDPAALEEAISPKEKPPFITEIAFERAGCFGPCPQFTVTFSSAGTVRYVGGEHAQLRGEHTGTISNRKFDQLAWFVRASGFLKMRDYYRYKDMMADSETTYTSVVADDKRKLICEYGGSGPRDLWVLQQLIEKLLLETTWDKPQPKPTK